VSAMAGARWRRWTRAPRQSRIGARPSPAEVAYVQIATIPSELLSSSVVLYQDGVDLEHFLAPDLGEVKDESVF
jgi:hypothetical protein